MLDECTRFETRRTKGSRWVGTLVEMVRTEIAYRAVVMELSALSPALLADIGIERRDIRSLARAAVKGVDARVLPGGDGPMTEIGSPVWSRARAYLLRLGSN